MNAPYVKESDRIDKLDDIAVSKITMRAALGNASDEINLEQTAIYRDCQLIRLSLCINAILKNGMDA